MANNFVAACYAICKAAGIDTSKMSAEQVIDKANELRGKKEAKEKATELVKKYVGNNNGKEKHSETNSTQQFKEYFVERVDRTDTEALKSKVIEYMDRIVKDNKEHNVIVDKDGNVFEKTGDETYVEDMGLNLDGAIDIHNHLENGSFEKDDFMFFRDKLNTEFIAVSPKYVHKVKVLKEIDKPYNYFYIRGMKEDDDYENQAHNIMEFIKSEGYIEYERISRNT